MKTNSIRTAFRWIAWILGGLMIAFFLMFFIGERVLDFPSETFTKLKPYEILGLALVGITLLGLIIAFWKPLVGGLMACIGIALFIAWDAVPDGGIMTLSDGWAFYLLFLAGFLHIVTWSLRRQRQSS